MNVAYFFILLHRVWLCNLHYPIEFSRIVIVPVLCLDIKKYCISICFLEYLHCQEKHIPSLSHWFQKKEERHKNR
jgi:hypothetical protein